MTGDATHGQSSLIPELGIVDINMSGGGMDLSAVFFPSPKRTSRPEHKVIHIKATEF